MHNKIIIKHFNIYSTFFQMQDISQLL